MGLNRFFFLKGTSNRSFRVSDSGGLREVDFEANTSIVPQWSSDPQRSKAEQWSPPKRRTKDSIPAPESKLLSLGIMSV